MIVKLVLVSRGLLAFSFQRGLSLWMILEINFISFIGLLGSSKASCQGNRALNYFLVQALGRSLMLITLILALMKSEQRYGALFFLALLLKLGGAPLNNWYLKVIQKLSWPFIWVLSCWQKIIPLLLVSLRDFKLLIFARFLSGLTGRLGALPQTSLKKIFGLSSIFTLAWILGAISVDKVVWCYFFLGYALTLAGLTMCIRIYFSDESRQTEASTTKTHLLIFFTFLLIIRGIPPFLGFFLKLTILLQLISFSVELAMTLVVLRLFLIFVYLVIIFNLFTLARPRNLKLSVKIWELNLLPDFIILNSILRIFFINFCACYWHYISNITRLLVLTQRTNLISSK